MTSAPTVALRPTAPGQPDQHDVFYLDQNSQVIQRLVTDGVPGPEHNLGAVLYPGSTVAAAWRPDGTAPRPLRPRHRERPVAEDLHLGRRLDRLDRHHRPGSTTSSPSAMSMDQRLIDVFYRAPGNVLQMRTYNLDGNPSGPVDLDKFVTTGPASVAIRADHGAAYYATDEHGVGTSVVKRVVFRAEFPGRTWAVEDMLPHHQATSTPAVAVRAGGGYQVTARNDSAGLSWGAITPPHGWTWQDYTAPSPAGSAPAIVTVPGLGSIAYLRGNDNRLIARLIS